jgi:hypothetical protein
MQEATKDMGIDDESSHPELCSAVADGVTRNIVCLFREPDAGNLPVRFDEREQETAPSQTGLRWRGESHVNKPPGDYSHCACSRLYSRLTLIEPLTGLLSAIACFSATIGKHYATNEEGNLPSYCNCYQYFICESEHS